MPFIGNQPALSFTSFAKQDFSTSATTSYTLDNPVTNANELALFINNVRQEPTTAYSANSNTLTLTEATSSSDDMYCVYLGKAVQTVTPPNNSVTGDMLSKPFNYDSGTLYLDDTNNRVGIGTTSPNAELEIKADTPEIRIDSTGASGRNYKIHSDGDELYLEGIGSSGSFKIGEDGTYGVNVDLGSGNVMIGTTSPDGKLTVNYQSPSNGAKFNITNSSSASNVLVFNNTNGTVGYIQTNGSSTSYNTSSDHRLKENLVDIEDATSRLKKLKPKRFNFIADADTTVDGFLAHEVQTVVPEAITGEKDAVNEDGTPDYQGIDQSKLVPLLVKTIQELEARITELENK
jgi:hypothetical protein